MTYNLDLLAHSLREQFPGILFAYVFGSAKDGEIAEGSDLDLAVWLESPADKLELVPAIIGAAESFAPGVSCDLLILNDAGEQISFEVLQGTRLFAREHALDLLAGFYSQTCRLYEDTLAWMKKQLQYRQYEVQWGH